MAGQKTRQDRVFLPRFRGYRVELFKRKGLVDPVWYMRVWLNDENRYFKRSLGTFDLESAQTSAENLLLKMVSAKESGQSSIGITLAQLVRDYLLWLKKEKLSEHTLANRERRVRYGAAFLADKLSKRQLNPATIHTLLDSISDPPLGLHTRVNTIDGTIFSDYLEWRQQKNASLRRDVVHQELINIRQMFHWAKGRKLCGERTIPQWSFKKEKTAKRELDALTLAQCSKVLELAAKWMKQTDLTPKQAYYRKMLYHMLCAMHSSGMRTGEALALRNFDIRALGRGLCTVDIRETKEHPRCIPVGERGKSNLILEWQKQQLHKKPDDYLFARFEGDKDKTAESPIGKCYADFRHAHGISDDVDMYSQRHSFITDALNAGAHMNDVATYCGTSVKMIAQTYGHVTHQDAGRRVLNKLHEYRENR